jgi:hypothetical protein
MPQPWQQDKLSGKIIDDIYAHVGKVESNLKTWVLNTIVEVMEKMATYAQAAEDAIAAINQLKTELQAAIDNDDMAAVQAVANRLEAAAQSVLAPSNPEPAPPVTNPAPPVDVTPSEPTTPTDSGTPDAPVVAAPADPGPNPQVSPDVPSTGAPAGTDTPSA